MRAVYRNPRELATKLKDVIDLYLEDLLDTLSDDGKLINKNVKEGIDKIIKKIDTILMEHLTYSDKMLEDINCEINSLSIKNTPLTTQEVFGMIAEELDL